MEFIKINCAYCNNQFEKELNAYNFASKKGKRFFCSLSCSAKINAIELKKKAEQRIEEYELNPVKCIVCESIIPYKYKTVQKFCSSSCSAVYNNSNRKKLTKCSFCQKETHNKKFCNKDCEINFRKDRTEQRINEGFKVKDKTFKSYLINKKGHRCEMCGFSEWGGKPILLILDHIDGNSQNIALDNLRLICSNCDTLTPTYKGRNRGNGRYARRLRYSENKSF